MKTLPQAEIDARNDAVLAYIVQLEELGDTTLVAAIRKDPAQGCFHCVWNEDGGYLMRCLAHGGDEDPDTSSARLINEA